MVERSGRLDSWKAIADYLGRDVRTAMRWAKSHGMPVRRVGGRGRSVFAFRDEIDVWLSGRPAEGTSEPLKPTTEPADVAIHPPGRLTRRRMAAASLAAVLATIAVLAGARDNPWTVVPEVGVEATESSVWITHGGRRSHLVSLQSEAPGTLTGRRPRIHDTDADGTPEVIIGISHYVDELNQRTQHGALINLSLEGALRWRFSFDDALAFKDERFDGPWVLSDWSIGPAASPSKVAVAAHHHTWWASMTAVIDHRGRREATFVNPGWIESLLWLDAKRIAVAGFNNARDAGMFAIVDPAETHTRAPGTEGTAFDCQSCGGGVPAYYTTLPRSELNVITAGRFNRARVIRENDRIVIRTVELEGPPSATAIYEFDRDSRLLRARYDDVYWDMHRRLELEGRLKHARENCPEREGPPVIGIWSGTHWQTVQTRRR